MGLQTILQVGLILIEAAAITAIAIYAHFLLRFHREISASNRGLLQSNLELHETTLAMQKAADVSSAIQAWVALRARSGDVPKEADSTLIAQRIAYCFPGARHEIAVIAAQREDALRNYQPDA